MTTKTIGRTIAGLKNQLDQLIREKEPLSSVVQDARDALLAVSNIQNIDRGLLASETPSSDAMKRLETVKALVDDIGKISIQERVKNFIKTLPIASREPCLTEVRPAFAPFRRDGMTEFTFTGRFPGKSKPYITMPNWNDKEEASPVSPTRITFRLGTARFLKILDDQLSLQRFTLHVPFNDSSWISGPKEAFYAVWLGGIPPLLKNIQLNYWWTEFKNTLPVCRQTLLMTLDETVMSGQHWDSSTKIDRKVSFPASEGCRIIPHSVNIFQEATAQSRVDYEITDQQITASMHIESEGDKMGRIQIYFSFQETFREVVKKTSTETHSLAWGEKIPLRPNDFSIEFAPFGGPRVVLTANTTHPYLKIVKRPGGYDLVAEPPT